MSKPFLHLNNWCEPQPKTRFDRFLATSGLTIECCRTTLGEIPRESSYCGAYVSPSFYSSYDNCEWVKQLHSIIVNLAEKRTPLIGLCFGSQVLASALVGRESVFKRNSHEGGRGVISFTVDGMNNPLCQGLPNQFEVFHWHGDEVHYDLPGIKILADSPNCGNQIWQWSKGLVWGVQPHPEMDESDLTDWLEHNRVTFERQGLNVDDFLAQSFTSDFGFSLLERFVELVKCDSRKVKTNQLAGHQPSHC